MISRFGFRATGTRVLTACIFLTAAGWANAQTIFTVNGVDVDSAVVDIYFESRLGGQGVQPTVEQREALMAELRDIYILATQDNAGAMAEDPRVAAQISLQRHSILAQAVASDYLSTVEVSEEEILEEYSAQVELAPPLQFKARHILVESQGAAVEIIGELDSGADFEELAREKSTGPSAPNGGDLGWFSPNQMVAPFSQAVQAMEDGAYSSEPVQTQFGWHVILREDSRETEAPTLDSVRDNLKVVVQQRKFQTHLEELRDAASE